MNEPKETNEAADGQSLSNAGLGMDVYAVTVKVDLYILANDSEEAGNVARKELDGIDCFLPRKTPGFYYSAYHTPNQSDWIKAKAINGDAQRLNLPATL